MVKFKSSINSFVTLQLSNCILFCYFSKANDGRMEWFFFQRVPNARLESVRQTSSNSFLIYVIFKNWINNQLLSVKIVTVHAACFQLSWASVCITMHKLTVFMSSIFVFPYRNQTHFPTIYQYLAVTTDSIDWKNWTNVDMRLIWNHLEKWKKINMSYPSNSTMECSLANKLQRHIV